MLSQSSSHVLRAACVIARTPGVGATEISRRARVPRRYLSKILGRLTGTGLLTARRGVRGGYWLSRPARDVRLMEIVSPFESTVLGPACILGGSRLCTAGGKCRAHPSWRRVKEGLRTFLTRTTLADIAGPASATRDRRPAR